MFVPGGSHRDHQGGRGGAGVQQGHPRQGRDPLRDGALRKGHGGALQGDEDQSKI